MSYDFYKYEDKRKKVLGIQRRLLSFGIISTLVSVAIFIGISFSVVPKVSEFLSERNLDDAIFKLEEQVEVSAVNFSSIEGKTGVIRVWHDDEKSRLIITFDRSIASIENIASLLDRSGVKASLLNRVEHRHREESR